MSTLPPSRGACICRGEEAGIECEVGGTWTSSFLWLSLFPKTFSVEDWLTIVPTLKGREEVESTRAAPAVARAALIRSSPRSWLGPVSVAAYRLRSEQLRRMLMSLCWREVRQVTI